MVEESLIEQASATLREINQDWLAGRVDDLTPHLHPEIVMVFPGFAGKIQGREAFLGGFRDFCENAKVHEFHERDHHVDVAGRTAVVGFRYEMLYERSGKGYRATGGDLWVFQREGNAWIAVWRAMLDMEEHPA